MSGWALMAWLGYDEPTQTHDHQSLRTVSESEFARLRYSQDLLSKLTSNNAFVDLIEAVNDLHGSVQNVGDEWDASPGGTPEGAIRRTKIAFKTFLSAFRSFDDR